MQHPKKSTPLSTMSLAAFLTWKQYDILVVLEEAPGLSATGVGMELDDIVKFDVKNGGAFYKGVSGAATRGALKTLQKRLLVRSHAVNGAHDIRWYVTNRGKKALRSLEAKIDQVA